MKQSSIWCHQCQWFPSRDFQVYWLLHCHLHSLPLVFLVHLLWFWLGCLSGRTVLSQVCKRSSLAKPPWAFSDLELRNGVDALITVECSSNHCCWVLWKARGRGSLRVYNINRQEKWKLEHEMHYHLPHLWTGRVKNKIICLVWATLVTFEVRQKEPCHYMNGSNQSLLTDQYRCAVLIFLYD